MLCNLYAQAVIAGNLKENTLKVIYCLLNVKSNPPQTKQHSSSVLITITVPFSNLNMTWPPLMLEHC